MRLTELTFAARTFDTRQSTKPTKPTTTTTTTTTMANEFDDWATDDNNSDCNSDDDDEELLTAADILSSDAMAALLEFQQTGGFFQDMPAAAAAAAAAPIISKNTVCATFTPGDSQMIAATYRRLQLKEEEAAKKHAQALLRRTVLELQVIDNVSHHDVLLRDGVVRVNNVLSADLCDACLDSINRDLLNADTDHISYDQDKPCDGFGNVFSRNHRYDMYLKNDGIYHEALRQMLLSSTSLGSLFSHLVGSEKPGIFHECSSLISDPGAASQPIHPDSPYSTVAPMWTCFVALQDVTTTMGPTMMLPQTHSSLIQHTRLKDPSQKDELLAECEYRRSLLQKGDCAVMDSRCFHFGDANTSDTRRVLLYFTIRNPAHEGEYPSCGSLFPDMSELTIGDFW